MSQRSSSSYIRLKLTSTTFNNASTRYVINPKACKRKRLIVCPKAKNNFNETYFQKLSLQTEQVGGFMAKTLKTDKQIKYRNRFVS